MRQAHLIASAAVGSLVVCLAPVAAAEVQQNTAAPVLAAPSDEAHPADLPAIGKWMIDPTGAIARWLGELVNGKALREPINVIIVDDGSATAQEAVDRIEVAAAAAGYPVRNGHSSGYRALIAGKLLPQLPSGHDKAFSNEVFEVTNNHGRLFGPYKFGSSFVFTGAFSREEARIAGSPHHVFDSFNQARDQFARSLDSKTEFKITAFVNLGNAIIGDKQVSTGDHDGMAVVLRAGSSRN